MKTWGSKKLAADWRTVSASCSDSSCCCEARGLVALIRSAWPGALLTVGHPVARSRRFNYGAGGGAVATSRASLIAATRRDEISRSWRDHAGDLCRPANDPRPMVRTNRTKYGDWVLSGMRSNTTRLHRRRRSQPTLKRFSIGLRHTLSRR